MSRNITISITEDGEFSEVTRHIGSIDPFGSLVDAFGDAVKAAGYGADSRFVALTYYWEALDEAADEFVESVGEPEVDAWDGEYRVGDIVKVTSGSGWDEEVVKGRIGQIIEFKEERVRLELIGRGPGPDNTWWVEQSALSLIDRA